MRNIRPGIVFLFLSVLFLSQSIFAQQVDLPRVSQKASVMQRIGLLDVTITYSRPNVKGRTVWGELVPYNQVWRTGADEASTIFLSEDVTLNGNRVPAGKYSLFTIPGKEEWTVIINKVASQWGAFVYDSTRDLLRFKVKPLESEFTESLEFAFENVTTNSAEVQIKWEKLKVPFTIQFDIDAKAYANIKKALHHAAADDWAVYAYSANYSADNKVHKDESMQWIDRSIQIKPNFYNYFVKAKLLANDGRHKEALSFIEKSRQAGKGDPEFRTYAPQLDKLAYELKAKKK